MRVPRIPFRFLLPLLGLLASATAGCSREESAEEVRRVVLDAGVLGQPPAEVERRLEALRFRDGRRLEVGSFDSSRSLIEASIRDAQGRPDEGWNLGVTVTFDSTRKARAVEAEDIAVNPL